MTCIINGNFPSKKSVRLWVQQDPESVLIRDPAIVNPRSNGSWFSANSLRAGESVLVTNHPKRTWFAKIGRKASGQLYVE